MSFPSSKGAPRKPSHLLKVKDLETIEEGEEILFRYRPETPFRLTDVAVLVHGPGNKQKRPFPEIRYVMVGNTIVSRWVERVPICHENCYITVAVGNRGPHRKVQVILRGDELARGSVDP